MLKFLKGISPVGAVSLSALIVAMQFAVPAQAQESLDALVSPEGGFGLGREALTEEVAAWDIDVRPDGLGLPAGSGDVWTGEEVFVAKCSSCHGDFGEAVGRWPVLAGGWDTLTRDDPVKTIGSYWPYLSTVYDYVNRAMPFGEAQSLTPDEIYAITAYLLYVNNLVEDDFELSNENFLEVRLPNEGNFFMDDRETTELVAFSDEACMSDCKDSVEITMRASVLDVTPGDTTDDAPEEAEPVEEATAEPVEAAEPEVAEAAVDPALIEAGKGVFRQCSACHNVGENARNAAGPHLNSIMGRTIGSIDGFRYSNVLKDAAEAGEDWTHDSLAAFLADPRGARPGTKMAFRGLRSDEDIAAILAYLESIEAQ